MTLNRQSLIFELKENLRNQKGPLFLRRKINHIVGLSHQGFLACPALSLDLQLLMIRKSAGYQMLDRELLWIS